LVERYQAHGVGPVTLRLYPEGRHEMLNETNRDEVHGDLLAWLDTLAL
jgi:alpha-beta hydrolase superfamily lysophospholipase